MSKGLLKATFSGGAILLGFIVALPRQAAAYVGPGDGAAWWQLASAALIASLFYARRIASWRRGDSSLHRQRYAGFLFAAFYAAVVSPVICDLYQARPVPRFNDIFLVGIVVAAYLFTWQAAASLLAIALLVSAWILPPYGTFAIANPEDWYRMVSFAVLSVFLVALVHRLKTRRALGAVRPGEQAQSLAAGD